MGDIQQHPLTEDPMVAMTTEDWAELEGELAELEATDPAVAAAAENYRETVDRILKRPERGRRPK